MEQINLVFCLIALNRYLFARTCSHLTFLRYKITFLAWCVCLNGRGESFLFNFPSMRMEKGHFKIGVIFMPPKSRCKKSKYVKNTHTYTPTTKSDNGNGIIGRGPLIPLLTPSFVQIYPTLHSTQSLFLPCFLASPQHHLISHVITGPNPVWPPKWGAQKKFSIFLLLLKFFIVNRKKKDKFIFTLFK